MLTKAFKGYLALIGGKIVLKENNSYKILPKTIVIQDGVIERFFGPEYTREKLEGLFYGIKFIELESNHIVYPGFLDLHTHYDYNVFPLWKNPREPQPWDNRHEWRKCKEYDRDIKDMYTYILANWGKKVNGRAKLGDLFQYFSELQGLAGGTTVMQEPFEISDDLYKEEYKAFLESMPIKHMLLRSTGVSEDLGLPKDGKVYSIVDFMKPAEDHRDVQPPIKTNDWKRQLTAEFTQFLSDLDNKRFDRINGYLVHLAEGRSGNPVPKYPGDNVVDAYSRNEFLDFTYKIQNAIRSMSDLKNMKI